MGRLDVIFRWCYRKNIFALGTADLNALAFDLFICDPIFSLTMFTLNDQSILPRLGILVCIVLAACRKSTITPTFDKLRSGDVTKSLMEILASEFVALSQPLQYNIVTSFDKLYPGACQALTWATEAGLYAP